MSSLLKFWLADLAQSINLGCLTRDHTLSQLERLCNHWHFRDHVRRSRSLDNDNPDTLRVRYIRPVVLLDRLVHRHEFHRPNLQARLSRLANSTCGLFLDRLSVPLCHLSRPIHPTINSCRRNVYIKTIVEWNVDMRFLIQFGGFASLGVGSKYEIDPVFASRHSLPCLVDARLRWVPLLVRLRDHLEYE